jgi:hypothetical protein
MSGVNRNILKNTSIPVMGEGPTNIELVTTSGSRWVLLNFPPTFLSSSNSGSCTGITLQWSPDPSFGFEPSSAYYAVTESMLSCEATSLSPLTSSNGWYQFINSEYSQTAPPYYLRAWQNKVGGGRGPYSDIVSLQTRIYGAEASVLNGNFSRYIFDVDGFSPTGSIWYSNIGGPGTAIFSASFSVTPDIVKRGGPNYDAIQTNGATITVPMGGGNVSQGQPINANIALVQGSATMILGGGVNSFFVSATTSSIAGMEASVRLSQPTGPIPQFPAGVNTINKLIGFTFTDAGLGPRNGNLTVDNVSVGTGGTIGTSIAVPGNSLVINTSADCIIREFNLSPQVTYDATVYHTKYGPGGVS